jgi:hypothetical protein
MSNPAAPFANRPAKPDVTRLASGAIAIFVGGAYQISDDAGAASLRDKLSALLPAPTPQQLYQQADAEFCRQLAAELEQVEAGGCAPPVFASKPHA